MVYARRNRLPSHVKVNKCGAIALQSFVRSLELADNVVFRVERNEDKSITLIPTDLTEVPTNTGK